MSKVFQIYERWTDLEKFYEKASEGRSRADFLRRLLGYNDGKTIHAFLAKVANMCESEADFEKYNRLMSIVLIMERNYENIVDDIEDLNSFVGKFILVPKVPFMEFLAGINPMNNHRIKTVKLQDSKYGIDILSTEETQLIEPTGSAYIYVKDEVAKKRILEEEAVTAFQKKAVSVLKDKRRRKLSTPFVFIAKGEDCNSYECSVVKRGGRFYFSHLNTKCEVVFI